MNPTTTASYVSALTASVLGMTVNEAVAVLGLILAVLTFFVNWYYKQQEFKLLQKKYRRYDDTE